MRSHWLEPYNAKLVDQMTKNELREGIAVIVDTHVASICALVGHWWSDSTNEYCFSAFILHFPDCAIYKAIVIPSLRFRGRNGAR